MEALLLLGGLALTGFQLNKDKTPEERHAVESTKVPVANEIPNGKEMSRDAAKDEQKKANAIFPLRYDLAFGRQIKGDLQPVTDLTHSNMTPSYSGMQNKYLVNDITLDKHTGGDFYQRPKKELYMTEIQEVQAPRDHSLDVIEATRQVISVRDDLNFYQLEREPAIQQPRITREDINSTELSKLRMDPSKEKLVPKSTYNVPLVPGKAMVSLPTMETGEITTDRPVTYFEGREMNSNRATVTAPTKYDDLILQDTTRGLGESSYYPMAQSQSMPLQSTLNLGYQSNRLNYGELERQATRQEYQVGADAGITDYQIKAPKRTSYTDNTMEAARRVIASTIQSYAPAPSETKKEQVMSTSRFGPSISRVKKDVLSQTKILIRDTVKQYVENNNYLAPATIKGSNQRADDEAVHTREVKTITVGEYIPNGSHDLGVVEMAPTTRNANRVMDARVNTGLYPGGLPSYQGDQTRGITDTTVPNDRMALNVQAHEQAREENPFIFNVASGL